MQSPYTITRTKPTSKGHKPGANGTASTVRWHEYVQKTGRQESWQGKTSFVNVRFSKCTFRIYGLFANFNSYCLHEPYPILCRHLHVQSTDFIITFVEGERLTGKNSIQIIDSKLQGQVLLSKSSQLSSHQFMPRYRRNFRQTILPDFSNANRDLGLCRPYTSFELLRHLHVSCLSIPLPLFLSSSPSLSLLLSLTAYPAL